jgi:8-oxo-dGTP pyrophosphatase MutT (NUDIX family)
MTNENHNPFKTLSKKVAYDNKWITVTHDDIITPAGTAGIYGKVHFKNYAIGIIPIDAEGNTYLVGQYRYVLNEYSWEIPEGGGLLENDILEAAKRELQEEVGLCAEKWTQIATLNTSNSVTDEIGLVFIAQELSATEAAPDDTEQLQIKKLPLSEAFEMARDGRIKDALSLVALLKLQLLMDKKLPHDPDSYKDYEGGGENKGRGL